LNPLDVEHNRKAALIGERVAEVQFENRVDPIGEQIRINNVNFTVVGTYTDVGGEEELRRIYIPYPTLRRTFAPGPAVGLIVFTTPDGKRWADMEAIARECLAERHRFDPKDPAAVFFFNPEREFRKVVNLFAGIDAFVVIVGVGTLFAGVVGVSNIMLVTVKERTREIGIRKALGATPLSIMSMILQEALFLTTLAGYGGLVVGIGVLEAVRRSGFRTDFFRDPQVDLTVAAGAVVVLVISGVVAGYLPARQAVRVKPIEALRHE